jgi:hypothetical protein
VDVGDTTQFSHLAGTLSAIAGDQPSFVLMLGDLTYANAANVTQQVVDQHFNDVMAFSTSAAYMPAWGNHEYESPAPTTCATTRAGCSCRTRRPRPARPRSPAAATTGLVRRRWRALHRVPGAVYVGHLAGLAGAGQRAAEPGAE